MYKAQHCNFAYLTAYWKRCGVVSPCCIDPCAPGALSWHCDDPQEAAASDSDEEDDFIYNPLKLPLGWDGKPIPYWLYKLHGLNQEFQCEICGGATYWGRRAFERHFREYRHQASMRFLGIPNTKNFYEITKVADAQKLWKNIQVGCLAKYSCTQSTPNHATL